MAKFDYMNFNDGGCHDSEFVVSAKQYTKEQAIEICISENEYLFEPEKYHGRHLRKPNIEDIEQKYVKWYVRAPEWCGYDDDGKGCYTFCHSCDRGSFPVWVIEYSKLVTPQ